MNEEKKGEKKKREKKEKQDRIRIPSDKNPLSRVADGVKHTGST